VSTAAPLAEVGLPPLREAVARRLPAVAAALDPGQAAALARDWASREAAGAQVASVRPGSVLLRPDGGCTLRYLVRLDPGARERLLLVEVPASGSNPVVRPFPADPELPTLTRALDPQLMRPLLGRVLPGTGGDRAVARCAVDVVRYPRHGRCVLRYRLSPGAGGPGELRHPVVFGKVYGDDGAAGTAAAALRLLRRGLSAGAHDAPVVVPRPLAVVEPLRLVLTEAVPGQPQLAGLLQAACSPAGPAASDGAELHAAVRTAARAAAAVHACRPPEVALPVRPASGERTAAEAELAALEPLWPEAAARLRRGAAEAWAAIGDDGADRTASGWPLAPVLSHGDLTPGQVLLDGSGFAALVDVDTLCLAEPALDVGRFLAYLHVAGRRRGAAAQPLLTGLTALFLETYLAASGVDAGPAARRLFLRRTAAHQGLTLARIGASACRQLKDDRLRAVVAVQDEGDEWMRSVAG
jgi:aminoglycoside phosphotransferase (APT) family kinase protein